MDLLEKSDELELIEIFQNLNLAHQAHQAFLHDEQPNEEDEVLRLVVEAPVVALNQNLQVQEEPFLPPNDVAPIEAREELLLLPDDVTPLDGDVVANLDEGNEDNPAEIAENREDGAPLLHRLQNIIQNIGMYDADA
ncbi:hypothetical protein TKK_0001285 [Trichogramma kaykai]